LGAAVGAAVGFGVSRGVGAGVFLGVGVGAGFAVGTEVAAGVALMIATGVVVGVGEAVVGRAVGAAIDGREITADALGAGVVPPGDAADPPQAATSTAMTKRRDAGTRAWADRTARPGVPTGAAVRRPPRGFIIDILQPPIPRKDNGCSSRP
jgi:hypothetical protein